MANKPLSTAFVFFYKLFAGVACLAFFFGGRALHEFAGMDRLVGEFIGILAAVALGGTAAIFRSLADQPSGTSDRDSDPADGPKRDKSSGD